MINLADGAQSDFPSENIADMASYSPDGDRMVYCVTDQEQSLWISKADGSSPRILIPPPIESAFPKWSPDGHKVVLVTRRSGEPWRVSLVSPDTGELEELFLPPANVLHPSWSPDGKQILFGMIPTINENAKLYTVDLKTRQVETVPGSSGLFTPAWSPDGRHIVALKGDTYQLELLDRSTGGWEVLTGPKFGYPVWSPDSRYVYTFHNDSDGPRFFRIDISTKAKAVEEVLHLSGFRLLERWIGFHPNGSLLAARNIGIQEVYALKLDRPAF